MLLLIGLDGATPEIIERLAARGRLPTLRALMRHGVYGRLGSSPNVNPISAWSSLLTGVNPGMHGLWGLSNMIPGTYDYQAPHARMLRAPTLPQLLTDRGLTAGTLFVPMTYPAREAEWATVSGWLAPSVEAEGFAYPARIADLAARHMEGHPLDVDLSGHASSGRYDLGVDAACAAIRAKCGLAEELLADRKWDMLAINFVETDRVARWFWHLSDPAHPSFQEDVAARHGESIEDVYAEADRAVARLSARLGPDDHLVVVSTYGMGVNHGAGACVPEMLEWLGLLQHYSTAGGAMHRAGGWLADAFGNACRRARELMPSALDRLLPTGETADAAGHANRASGIDYERSFVLPAPGGHMFINAEGQFPRGHVNEEVAARIMGQVSATLASAIDPANGRQPLEALVKREDVCNGPYLKRLPHLIANWRATVPVTGLTVTDREGHVRVAGRSGRVLSSGAPASEGIFIAAGAGMRRGTRIEDLRLEDVTATALYLCGEGVPSYFDGRVLREAVSAGWLEAHPVISDQRDLPKIIDDAERSERIGEIVARHLAARGYAD